MARYIDADKFEKEIQQEASESIANAVIRIIDRQPTADAEEVVRCTDCIFCKNMKCTELKDNTGHPLDVAIFDYCSQGVRKER